MPAGLPPPGRVLVTPADSPAHLSPQAWAEPAAFCSNASEPIAVAAATDDAPAPSTTVKMPKSATNTTPKATSKSTPKATPGPQTRSRTGATPAAKLQQVQVTPPQQAPTPPQQAPTPPQQETTASQKTTVTAKVVTPQRLMGTSPQLMGTSPQLKATPVQQACTPSKVTKTPQEDFSCASTANGEAAPDGVATKQSKLGSPKLATAGATTPEATVCKVQGDKASKIGPPKLSTYRRAEEIPPDSETLELEKAQKEVQELQRQRQKWRARLSKVLDDNGSRLPARSTAKLTMPEEFQFSSRSTPTTPRSDYKPVAEKVKDFTKTPRRFRSRGVSQPTSPLPMGAAPKLTCSKSMQLFTEVRAITRTSSVKSTAQIEEEEMSSMPKFKALPLNKKVLESHGDMGVPRVQRPPSTKPTEFNLSTSMRGEARKKDDDELSTSSAPAYTFKARPYNKQKMAGTANGITQVTPRKVTQPRAPSLSTSNRTRREPPAAEEEFSIFKARPLPASTFSSQKMKSPRHEERPITSPRPFSLESETRRQLAEAKRSAQLEREREEEECARQFKARPMPVGDAWAPSCDSQTRHVTQPKPFDLSTEARGGLHSEHLAMGQSEEERQAKALREFHARPAKVVTQAPFVPRKSTRALTEINGFNIHTDVRSEARKNAEVAAQERRARQATVTAEKERQRKKQEAAELVELRKSLVFKARPMLKSAPWKVQKATRELTKTEAPQLHASARASARA